MELKEGMYIKTKQGEIHKIKSINEEYIEYENGFGVPYDLKDYYITKASHNIIDLIEVGDYVNGYKVVDISVTYFNGIDRRKEAKRIGIKVINGKFDYENYIEVEEIKSIVTKEQFESISNKVGE